METLQPKLRFTEFNDSWVKKNLSDTGEFIGGGTPDTSKDEFWNGDINWFTPTEIKNDNVTNSLRKISSLGLQKSSAKLLPIGTILLTTRATIGDVAISKAVCSTNQGFQSLVTNEFCNNYFIFNWFKKSKHLLMEKANGSTFPEISKSALEKISLNLPSLEEQTKIANFLSAVDEKLNLLKEKKSLLEDYKKGIMQKIFNQEIRFKDNNGNDFEGWEEKTLGELCEYKNGGSFEKYVCDDGIYNLISLNSIDINGKIKNSHKKVSITDNSLQKGDLIMVLSDVAHGNFLGLTDIVPDDNFVLNQRMGALKPILNFNSFYLKTFINYNQSYFKLMGQGSSQQNLSKGDIECFNVKLPCLDEQTKIANFISAIDDKIELVSNQIQETQEYKKGLLQQMFV